MPSSEEYLASLGFDTSDVDKATNQTITLLGHLGAQFDSLQRPAERAERALGGVGRNSRTATDGARELNTQVASTNSNLPRLRYALYDVSTTLTAVGIGFTAVAAASYYTAIRFQRDFADVQRTTGATGDSLKRLRAEFYDLYSTIPLAFGELTQIGELGGQLNIPERRLADFTKSVAQLAATSDVSIDAAATAFGRLDQLLPDVQGNYTALGDAVSKVGVNSVATESDIISITSQIASMANQAGLTSNEVIALSGTLASLGTRPELARGTVTRLFGRIELAVAAGGETLADFAKVSGRTASEFRDDWGQDSMAVLIDLFDGIEASGATQTLRQLGLTATRDTVVLSKLAQNTDLLAESLDNAANSGGEMERQYSIIASTVSEKLQVLTNNFQLLLATTGEAATGLGGVLDIAIALLKAFNDLAANPVASSIISITVAAAALSGVIALLLGLAARGVASVAALSTALSEMNAVSGVSVLSLRSVSAQMFGMGTGGRIAAAGVNAVSAATKGLLAVTALMLAEDVVGGLFEWSEGMRGFRAETEAVKKELEELTGGNLQARINELFGAANIGETPQFSFKQLSDPNLGGLANFGADVQKAIGGLVELQSLGLVDLSLSRIRDNLLEVDAAMAQLVSSGNIDQAKAAFEALQQTEAGQNVTTEQLLGLLPQYSSAMDDVAAANEAAGAGAEDLTQQISDTISAFSEVENATINTQNAIYGLGQSLGANGADFSNFSVAGRENMAALLQTIDAIAAETPGDAAQIAANLQALFNMLVQGAGVSAAQLGFLRSTIASLQAQAGGRIATATVQFNDFFSGISSGAQKAARSTGSAAKQIRTLVDYANDLSQVLERAFDIRFGPSQGLDAIRSGWLDIAEEIEDANRNIRDHRIEVQQLTADRSVREYWLSVAEAYGDTLRAGKLRAEIAEIDAELADRSKDVATEQQKVSKGLTGNSQAAIDNRAQIYGLIGDYNDYIKSLAASGASQAELQRESQRLKQEFISQAVQMGFNRQEVMKFATSFDDMATAIKGVPRNITVKANTNPALQALNELHARARKLGNSSYPGPTIGKPRVTPLSWTEWARANATGISASASAAAWARYIAQAKARYNQYLRGYEIGGWTGGGNPRDVAGLVHKREFVLNRTGAQMFPRQMLEAANQGRAPTLPVINLGGSDDSGVTELGPRTMRELIGAIGSIYFGLTDSEVGQAVDRYHERKRRGGG